jgi:type I site-specific restriction endonuclease
LDETLDGKKVFEHYDPDFFDLVIIDECHRSGFGDWFGILEHFTSALQLGLTATPRDLEEGNRELTEEEIRRDTYHYFGEPVFTYSLKQAIEDGYLVPYLLEERITNVDEEGFTVPTAAVTRRPTLSARFACPIARKRLPKTCGRSWASTDCRTKRRLSFAWTTLTQRF